MAKQGPKGKVIDFQSARKTSEPKAHIKTAANAPAQQRSGFLDAWLKNHEDSQTLIQENLSLREQARQLKDQQQDLMPTLKEHILYYSLLLISLGVAIVLVLINL